jgi:hypothetical protein
MKKCEICNCREVRDVEREGRRKESWKNCIEVRDVESEGGRGEKGR